jgi:DNA (cytosine-5)-methyltransferase 1
MVAPTVISLFAGCGGSSLGYQQAGFEELLAIDINPIATKLFQHNLPNVPFWQRDITQITSEEILSFCHIAKEELWHLDGSPPCQTFSTAGRAMGNKILDERTTLVYHNLRLIQELAPKTFLIENVTGMVKGDSKGIFINLMRKLKAFPYEVKAAKLNAAWYGVPQARERIIILGKRNDLDGELGWPKPHSKLIPLQDVLPNLRIIESQPGFQNGRGRGPNRVAPTVSAEYMLVIEKNGRRRDLNFEEAKILQGFPQTYELGEVATSNGRYYMGNAVPPPLIRAVANHIRETIYENLTEEKAERIGKETS